MQGFILNADDFGMDAGVDDAILALAEGGIVTATSVMVLSPACRASVPNLAMAPIDKGLHLDFTSGYGEGHYRLGPLIVSAWRRRLDPAALRQGIARQLDAFEDILGCPPTFVDGHQHVHLLPQIRSILVDELRQRYGTALPRLRACRPARWRGPKAWLVAATGAPGQKGLEGIRMNSDFAGVYDFSPTAPLPNLWREWLGSLQGNAPLVMAHVARPGAEDRDDPIRSARLREFTWLGSDQFRELCRSQGRKPARWSNLDPANS